MSNSYYLQAMVAQNLSYDIIESLVQVGRGYFDAILRKIIYINMGDPSVYANLNKTIAKTIALQLNTAQEQLLIIFGQRFYLNNFFNMHHIEVQIQQILKEKSKKMQKNQQIVLMNNSQGLCQDNSNSYFSFQKTDPQLSVYQLSCDSKKLQEDESSDLQIDYLHSEHEKNSINYNNWNQSRFMDQKQQIWKNQFIKKRKDQKKQNIEIQNMIRTNADLQAPSFLRFNKLNKMKTQLMFDPIIQQKHQILTHIQSILIPKTELSMFCQQLKTQYPVYERKLKNNIFHISAKIKLCNTFTKFVQINYQGAGRAANLKMAQNQASIDLLSQIWVQIPQMWRQFKHRKWGNQKKQYNF